MGLFDTVHLECTHDFYCDACAHQFTELQTKDLNSALSNYIFDGETFSELGAPKSEFWTDDPDHVQNEGTIFEWRPGGYFRAEGYDLKNRDVIRMVTNLHTRMRMYSPCPKCKAWNEWELKWTDGELMTVTRKGQT